MIGFPGTIVACACIALASGAITPSASLINKYTFHLSLDDNENYWLFWSIDDGAGDISFAVQANTAGWVGFGLSPNGRMPNSDIVTGWVNDNGDAFLQDRFSTGKFLPSDAESQDVELVAASETNQVTTLEFKRKVKACDAKDRSIDVGTSRVIWSYNPNDPQNDSPSALQQHTVMGWRSVNLLYGAPVPKVPLPDDVEEFDVRLSNVRVPTSATTYWCSNFTLPVIPGGANIVGFAPIVTPGNEGIVHHIVVFQCFNKTGFDFGYNGACNGNKPDEVSNCLGTAPVAAWAIGGTEVRFPADVGYPFSGDTTLHSVAIEMHYDNPQGKQNVIDSSGIKLYYTKTKRKNEATIIQFGHINSLSLLLPKGQKNVVTKNLCPAECTQKGFPDDGINVVGVTLHAHTAATAMKLGHIRNGKQLPYLDRNDHYDFNYQNAYYLPQPIKLLPGDILETVCNYSTEGRTKVTIGGLGTQDEMCLAFVMVYPAPKFSICLSQIPGAVTKAFVDEAFAKGWATPYNGDDQYQLLQGLNNMDLSNPPAAGDAYYAFWNTTKRTAFCRDSQKRIIAGGDYTMPSYVPLVPGPPPVCSTSAPTGPTSAGYNEVFSAFSLLTSVIVLVS
ncbi:DBH-like monooxygenase protein 1 [Oscarella lobularis]|uniref:DBH-like monooxygenase protein 1 n=1 Tax=Oscarella lobularis TaxID=121494 RepID=UPI0033141187